METIDFDCPRCGQPLAVEAAHVGQLVQCPHCLQEVPAPEPPVAPTPASEAAPSMQAPPESEPFASSYERVEARSEVGSSSSMISEELPPPAERAPHSGSEGLADAAPPVPEEPDSLPPAPLPRRPARRSILGPLLLIFLVPYAVVTTAYIAWQIYNQSKTVPFDPLERLPDPKPGSGGAMRIHPHSPVPGKLKTSLNQPLRVGDLEVTPLRVKKDEQERLCLYLKLRNLSEDIAFAPLLPMESYVFKRQKRDETGPYTYLEVDGQRLYMRDAGWEDPPPRKEEALFDGMLRPGEQLIINFRTWEKDKGTIAAAEAAQKNFLWRVQLRRGLVPVQDTEVSATAVVGVEFGSRAIGQDQNAVAATAELLKRF
jgi:hypothetical protein